MDGSKVHTVDLTKVKGDGSIKCPSCGAQISPDDTTEDTYTVVEPVMRESRLDKILLQCNKCGCKINLVGFKGTGKRN